LDLAARRRIVAAAEWLQRVPYDYSHSDDSWQNLYAPPASLDCSSFVCRVACEALGYSVGTLGTDANWLLDNLAHVTGGVPEPGDIVGYYRKAMTSMERLIAGPRVWHVMMFVGRDRITGRDTVVGACDLAGRVEVRPIVYEQHWGARRWRRIGEGIDPPAPFRRLALRTV